MSNPLALLFNFLFRHLIALSFIVFFGIAYFCQDTLWPINDKDSSAVTQKNAEIHTLKGIKKEKTMPLVASPLVEAEIEPIVIDKKSELVQDSDNDFEVSTSASAEKDAKSKISSLNKKGVQPASDLLEQARKAYWAGAMFEAENLYHRHIQQYPKDAHAFGELGIVYQSMGRQNDALNAYFEAGKGFKHLGDQERLMQIIELFDVLHDSRASILRQR